MAGDEAARCRLRNEGEGSVDASNVSLNLIHLAEALRLYPDTEASSVF